jgi:hypothetical protein
MLAPSIIRMADRVEILCSLVMRAIEPRYEFGGKCLVQWRTAAAELAADSTTRRVAPHTFQHRQQ